MNQYLLDTNIVIWFSENNPRIREIKSFILSTESHIFISAVSWWEIAIKVRTGKLKVDLRELRSRAEQYYFTELPMTGRYTDVYLELPVYHKDPFDLMLLAQAISTPMRLITGDPLLAQYSSLVMVI
ncbi:MAG: type II toxin-antitoxin system VapC family toxin [Treponema sp.]|nr:type II toxin-antitoxin system VapC family toxin [Treponema sp.]